MIGLQLLELSKKNYFVSKCFDFSWITFQKHVMQEASFSIGAQCLNMKKIAPR